MNSSGANSSTQRNSSHSADKCVACKIQQRRDRSPRPYYEPLVKKLQHVQFIGSQLHIPHIKRFLIWEEAAVYAWI